MLYSDILNYIFAKEDRLDEGLSSQDTRNIVGLPPKPDKMKHTCPLEISKSLQMLWKEEAAIYQEVFPNAAPQVATSTVDFSSNLEGAFIDESTLSQSMDEEFSNE